MSDGTATAAPESSEAWKLSTAEASGSPAAPGFCNVMYSWNPGLTVPSANRCNPKADSAVAPITVVPPSDPPARSVWKYSGRSTTMGLSAVTRAARLSGVGTPLSVM